MLCSSANSCIVTVSWPWCVQIRFTRCGRVPQTDVPRMPSQLMFCAQEQQQQQPNVPQSCIRLKVWLQVQRTASKKLVNIPVMDDSLVWSSLSWTDGTKSVTSACWMSCCHDSTVPGAANIHPRVQVRWPYPQWQMYFHGVLTFPNKDRY